MLRAASPTTELNNNVGDAALSVPHNTAQYPQYPQKQKENANAFSLIIYFNIGSSPSTPSTVDGSGIISFGYTLKPTLKASLDIPGESFTIRDTT